MLTDPVEIEIISKAKQKNVRKPQRSRAHFDHIFEHFLSQIDFNGKMYLDMGPGQFDFGVLVRERGGDVISIDNDPAVIALGEHKGFTCLEADLRELSRLELPQKVDGIFCKFSISAFWFDTDTQSELTIALDSLLKPGGWIWIAPWNGAPGDDDVQDIQSVLRGQIDAFTSIGCEVWELSEAAARHFGVRGTVENNVLFTKGVQIPDDNGLLRAVSRDTPSGTGAPWPKPKITTKKRSSSSSGTGTKISRLLGKIRAAFGKSNSG